MITGIPDSSHPVQYPVNFQLFVFSFSVAFTKVFLSDDMAKLISMYVLSFFFSFLMKIIIIIVWGKDKHLNRFFPFLICQYSWMKEKLESKLSNRSLVAHTAYECSTV